MKVFNLPVQLAIALLFLPHLVQGQSFEEPEIWGNGFGGAGVITDGGESTGIFHLGGGIQGLLTDSFGLEADVGYFASFDYPGDGIGIFSPGAFYSLSENPRTTPFVEGGYSLFFRSGAGNGVYFGGGVNHWFSNNLGIQLAARDQVMVEGNSFHVIELRLGLLFK